MLRVAPDHYSHSDTGRQRRTNEDSYLARAPIFVVADGMGGAQAGEVASHMAVETFEQGLGAASSASAEELLAARVLEANARIHEMSQAEQQHAGMGTTLTAAHVGEHDVAIAHVGDSRAYRLRGGEFERLTEDHSLVEEMRRRGQLTAEEADEHPQRSVITRALGPEAAVQVDTHSWRGEAGDIYLLCSDGLTSMVAESRVAEIVRSSTSLPDAGRTLIAAANDAGGRDNITVVLFALEEVDQPEPPVEQPTSAGQAALKTADVRVAAERDAQAAVAPAPQAQGRRLQPRLPSSQAPPKRKRRSRRFAMAFAIFALLVIPLSLGGYVANQAVYFVGTDANGFVTVYRGLPYDLPGGISMYTTNYVSGVPLSSLPARRRKQLTDHTLRSHDDVTDLVRELELGRLQS
jgi:serine/threonine protein phosphatase PrpC